ncbi:unnamed protein product, partial [Amoebophrya sp. A25]
QGHYGLVAEVDWSVMLPRAALWTMRLRTVPLNKSSVFSSRMPISLVVSLTARPRFRSLDGTQRSCPCPFYFTFNKQQPTALPQDLGATESRLPNPKE